MATSFSFGGSAAAGSTASSPFSFSTTPSAFSFSQPAAASSPAAAPAFGSSLFSASAAASSTPTFGSSLFGASSAASPASTAVGSSPFGFGSTGFSFGQPTAAASSAAPAPSLLGTPAASSAGTTPGLFGTASTAASTPSLFGASATGSATTTPGLFGATSAAATTPGLFGAASSAATTPSLFGATSAAATTPSLFGAASSAASTPSLFSGASTGFSFGSSAAGSTATTAAASTPSFGFSFGSGAAASSTASTPASAPSLGFGATTGSSLFGSTTSAPLFSTATASSLATAAPSFGFSASPATTASTPSFGFTPSSASTTTANTAPSSAPAFAFAKSTSPTTATPASTPSTGFSLATSHAASAPSLFSTTSAAGSSSASTLGFSFGSSSAASTPTLVSVSATGASTLPSATAAPATSGSPGFPGLRRKDRSFLGFPARTGPPREAPAAASRSMRSVDAAGAERSDQHNRKKPRLETGMPLVDAVVAGGGGGSGAAGVECGSMAVEEIVQHPLPGYGAPTALSFSPDDQRVAYLYSPDGTLHRKVFTFDLAQRRQELLYGPPDGGELEESNLSAEERLRRERARERGLGVTRYEWRARHSGGPSSRAGIVVPLPSGVYFQDLSGSEPVLKLQSSPTSPIIDPHLSPNGSMIAYVKDDELHTLGFSDGEPRQLTYGARESGKIHGLAEYIAQEEMERKMGFWWSPDSKHLAFTEVDSSEIPLYRIMHQGKSSVGPDAQEDHAYPFAGAANVKVRLGVVPSHGGEITWMDLLCGDPNGAHGDEEYLARVNWMHSNALAVQVLNRTHTKLKLLKFDIATGKREVLLEEEHDIWITLHDCFTPLDKGVNSKHPGGFIWASEKTGFRHLYVHDKNGVCLGPLTQGDWMVEQISGANESSGLIYFTGTLDGPLETNLYHASLFPDWSLPLQPPKRLTHGTGRHSVILDHQLLRFIDVYDSIKAPPMILLCSLLDGTVIMSLIEQPLTVPPLKNFQQLSPEIVQITAKDGTTLYGTVYLPDERKYGPPPYKTLINVYGGPSVQLVSDSWMSTVDMRAQYLRSKGILVWKMDNRGSARRGLHFEGQLKYNIGRVDAEDQLTGAEWLIKQGLAKPGHIGLYGWSYGGFLSAMCLARFPEMFCCAVSGAPVTAWDGYDTFYTEKYMGLPSEHSDAYEFGSIMHHVKTLKGKLLLIHGMIDENVHFRHTARLINSLMAEGKPYEILLFPDERHMPRRLSDRIYMEERIWDFVERSL